MIGNKHSVQTENVENNNCLSFLNSNEILDQITFAIVNGTVAISHTRIKNEAPSVNVNNDSFHKIIRYYRYH